MSKEEKKILEGKITLPYRWALGPVYARFFDEFKNKKIMGTKCPKCGRVLVPSRKFCPHCFENTPEEVQVKDEGILRSWVWVNYSFSGEPKKPPYIIGRVDLYGADTALFHFIGGIDVSNLERIKEKVKIGMKVRAKWRDVTEGDIFDIDYFEPV